MKPFALVAASALVLMAGADAWCFRAFNQQNYCGKFSEHHRYTGGGGCFNLISPVAGNVNSFSYVASGSCDISFHSDYGCNGSKLGSTVGSWNKATTSASGKKMKSFRISGALCKLDARQCSEAKKCK
ncbi:hypothetical protein K493DRAFT_358196 [Basidiobolus meristosporus CBS 931.73]|uniref:Uncharacterized protein n=1 Tax=Basidiobolus meristosporus CBS 931.73 TaxID=1314790 RepID=A0A1Y1XUJ0_9FUNG|nr:hypothetical protein K493DRAFT_358196 [Basidiobolus meristosporus CBS 931.73]|eukprot:ORX89383.1 hypothetical protein K493DRAFT_358196 [Basidiobolus meristosporus CBS 931.73]